MKTDSPIAHWVAALVCLIGGAFFASALYEMSALWASASAFRLHHEVTTPMAFLLAKVIAGIFAGCIALVILGRARSFGFDPKTALPGLAFVAMLFVVVGRILENEWFFTLYDNKAIPVHPSEIVMHPNAGWMTPGAHALVCILGVAGCLVALVLTRRVENR